MANINTIPNFHIIKATFMHVTYANGPRIKIESERFKQKIIISFFADKEELEDGYMNTHALHWLKLNGFEIIGRGEGKDHFYFISTTFQPLKK